MRWTFLPQFRRTFLENELDSRAFWRFHAPVVAGTWLVFATPLVRRWLGVRAEWLALPFLVHLLLFGSMVRRHRILGFAGMLAMSALNAIAGAMPAASTARATSPLWLLYAAYPLVVARAAPPSFAFFAFVLALPPVAGVAWLAIGAVHEIAWEVLAGIGLAAALLYAFMAQVDTNQYEKRSAADERWRLAAAEEERKRIAQELHSTLGSALSEVSLWQDVATAGQGEDARRALGRAAERTRRALDELRAFVQKVDGRDVEGVTMRELLQRRIEGLCAAGGLHVRVDVDARHSLPAERAWHVLKFVEEGTLNAVRHARARNIEISARLTGPIRLEVRDDGTGFDRQLVAPGHGLQSLEAHARALGALLLVDSAPGKGTRVGLDAPRGLS